MPRIAQRPVSVTAGVTVALEPTLVTVTGPKGKLSMVVPGGVALVLASNEIAVRATEVATPLAMVGTVRQLVQNMVSGVTKGFSKSLTIVGTGYRASVNGSELTLHVGFSHPVVRSLPEGILATVEKNTIVIQGPDKQKVGEVAAQIRRIRKPEPYKGIGIRYTNEVVRKKAGKQVKGVK